MREMRKQAEIGSDGQARGRSGVVLEASKRDRSQPDRQGRLN
jgi:hypothetical protein